MVLPSQSAAHVTTYDVMVGRWQLPGFLSVPPHASSLVLFAHGSGSSRFSGRNQEVAHALNSVGIATLLFDLLRPEEESEHGRAKVFDIGFLSGRLTDAVEWADDVGGYFPSIGLFGASTGAAAALVTAAKLGSRIGAVVSRGGRPDLAGNALSRVVSPTLLIVGGADHGVIELNQAALSRMRGLASMEIVPGATHLFPEPGAMQKVTALARNWFERYLSDNPT